MKLSGLIFRLKTFNEEIEFFSIITFLLFFPDKTSFLYFLLFGFLIILFLTRKILTSNNFGVSGFSIFLLIFNIVLIFTSFFSIYILNSLLFFFDLFLISFYYLFGYHKMTGDKKRISNIAYLFSFFSFFQIVIFLVTDNKTFFFKNPILSGIISGFAILILLFNLIEKTSIPEIILMIISLTALYIAGSKAAFIGVIGLSLAMILAKNRKLLLLFFTLLLITLFFQNPIKEMFERSLYKDPYSKNRVDIWKLSLRMFGEFPLTGVGPDNFGEVSQQFNFKQLQGPANYFKVPRSPHNDYLKIIAENGLPGLFIILFFLFFLFKRFQTGSIYDIRKILVIYLLFQALLFNIIFKTVYFFLFLYLLRTLFPENRKYISNSSTLKLSILATLSITIITGYISPYISESNLFRIRSDQPADINMEYLNKAQRFNPLDARIHYAKSLIYFNSFKKNFKLDNFPRTLTCLNNAIRLDRYFLDAYLLKSDLFLSLLKNGIVYPGLKNEILSPLVRYERYNPFNPFVALEKANIYLKLGESGQAKKEALKSLRIEPDFISAIYFLHKNFNYFGSKTAFEDKINSVMKKKKSLTLKPGEYLFSLYKLPEEIRKRD